MPHLAVGELDLYYETYGDGPPALLISGTGNDLRKSFPDKSPLNTVCSTTHYDQRGLGQSSKPDVAYTMADYADDAAELLDALGIEQAVVMGVSFGGMVAQNLVARHPGRASKLVLACTSSGGAGGSSADLLALSKLPAEDRVAASMAIVDTRLATAPEGEDYGLGFYQAYVSQPADTSPEAEQGRNRQLEARGQHDVWEALPDFDVPTYVCGGRYDGISPPANLEAIANRIPGAQLEFFDGGHLFMLQDSTVWPAILNFVTS